MKKMTKKTHCALAILGVGLLALSAPAAAEKPLVSDSRIKTLVYNENDVFLVETHYGYQVNIEFGEKEIIQTISLGDRGGWQVAPVGRRIFIRPLIAKARTNMTVITNKHTYQFDLASRSGPLEPNQQLAYVVRFYYPEKGGEAIPPIAATANDLLAATENVAPAAVAPAAPDFNFDYTYEGPDRYAPLKVYDDGRFTFLKMPQQPSGQAPAFSTVAPDGQERPIEATVQGDLHVVASVAPRIVARYGEARVDVYNEKY